MGILGGDGGSLRISLACVDSQVSFEMFKRYAALHVKRHFAWLHTYNLVVKWCLRRAYTWSNIAPKFPPSTAWVLMRCRSIRDNSAPSSGTHKDVATLCRAYIRRAWTCCVICSDRILTCRIKSICSPAKGGTGCYRFNYQPGS